jgi:hypothetical protein
MLSNIQKHKSKEKSKPILLSGTAGTFGFGISRIQHFSENRLTDGSEIASLTRRLRFTPQ